MKTEPDFKSEADLCAAFIGQIGPDWTAYAETGGFDILLSRGGDGFQIGIEAKLRFGAAVIEQALPGRHCYETGPDCRAVLVPRGERTLTKLCHHVGLTIITILKSGFTPPWSATPSLPRIGKDHWHEEWFELCPANRIKLPSYVPDVVAGSSAPIQLTDWKIKALKIGVLLEIRGHVTRSDFKEVGIDYRRWTTPGSGWLRATERGFVSASKLPPFADQHPRVFEEIKRDHLKWMTPRMLASLRENAEAA